MSALAIVHGVNFFRLLPLLAAALLLTGCANSFTRFRVSNYRDEIIAEWVARGRVQPIERGYRITAVERISGPPYRTLTRYPDGWRTNVVGPHIWRWRCPKPLWLAELEGDAPPPPVPVSCPPSHLVSADR